MIFYKVCLMDEVKVVDVSFLEFSQAFDTGPHSIFLGKVSNRGMSQFTVHWVLLLDLAMGHIYHNPAEGLVSGDPASPSHMAPSSILRSVWSLLPLMVSMAFALPYFQQGSLTALPGGQQKRVEELQADFLRFMATDMEQSQRSLDTEQQLKVRDRQKFFEEVFQHDVDFFFPMSHLQIEHRRPPLGSISSMEVNVDMLEQMDMMDLSDQDTVDVFLGCGTEESSITGPLPGADAGQCTEEITLQVPNTAESKSRISSTSSVSTDLNSLDTSEEGAETPVVQSDEEDLQEDSPKEQEARS
ncbi:dysbindin domain-containing protein 2 [Pelecanus crispus]|uniref:dysbindin domain-containing protein 2 n=1 Tax=Pelecanus crispus TaxID=36300 RepID=UPI003F5D0D67